MDDDQIPQATVSQIEKRMINHKGVKTEAYRFRHDVAFPEQLERINGAEEAKHPGPSIRELENESADRGKHDAGDRA